MIVNEVYAQLLPRIVERASRLVVGVHPFGGFNMSATDTKAGGPDYLLFFLQGKAVGERPG